MPNEPTRVFDFVLFQYTFTKVIQRYKYLNTKAKTANASKKMEEHKEKVEEYFAKDQDSDRGVDEENEFVNQDIINEYDVQAEFEWYENLKNKNKEIKPPAETKYNKLKVMDILNRWKDEESDEDE